MLLPGVGAVNRYLTMGDDENASQDGGKGEGHMTRRYDWLCNVVAVVVLAFTRSHNLVRGHRRGSNNSTT